MNIWDLIKPQSDRERAALWQGLFNVGGSALQTYGQGQQQQANNQLSSEQWWQNNQQGKLNSAAGMFGNGPFDVTQQRQSTLMRHPLLFGGEGGGPMKLSGTPNDPAIRGTYTSPQIGGEKWDAIEPFFRPEAVGNDESYYRNMAQQVAGGQLPAFNYTSAGYGPGIGAGLNASGAANTAAAKAKNTSEYQALQQALGQGEEDDGGGFWSGLMKIGQFALPFIPGIGPVASGLLSAGLGAGSAAASGKGLGGILGGAAMGGLGGYGVDKYLGGKLPWLQGKVPTVPKGRYSSPELL